MPIPKTLPTLVVEALEALCRDVAPLHPEPRALVLYGPAVRDAVVPAESEIPLAVVIGEAKKTLLKALKPALRKAFRHARVEPMIVTESEVVRLADAFPIKVLELKRHGVAIHGDNPFEHVEVKPTDVRLRLEQELRNHLMRLRRHAAFTDDELGHARPLHRSATVLPMELDALLRLAGHEPKKDRIDSIYIAASKAFALDLTTLQKMAAYEQGRRTKDPEGLVFDLIGVLERAVEVVDTLEIAS